MSSSENYTEPKGYITHNWNNYQLLKENFQIES